MPTLFYKNFRQVLIFTILLLSLFSINDLSAQVYRKTPVEFKASDGLLISANIFQSKKSNPWLILFHQEKSNKSEFDSIISRFIKMNFNCMAVDLRSGDNFDFSKNETAERAKEKGLPSSLRDAQLDIEAAIDYLLSSTGKKCNLFGSASSASLVLMTGRENANINAVVAFNPGDYFAPEYDLKNILANYPKPVFVATTADEFDYFGEIEGLPGHDRILFKPTSGNGLRGTHALLKENPNRDEYWLSLLLFFKSLQQ